MTAQVEVLAESATDPWAHTVAPSQAAWVPGDARLGGRWEPVCCAGRDTAVAAAGGPDALAITASSTTRAVSVFTEWSTLEGVPVVADEVGSTCRHARWVPAGR